MEIADPLLETARETARETAHRQGTPPRSLVAEGPRLALERREGREPLRLREARVERDGLCPELLGSSWDALRDLACEGREP